jgi:hypothetical protein
VWGSCVSPATRALGEQCLGDAECGTGICCDGVCSECCGVSSCADGAVCLRRAEADVDDDRIPPQCPAGRASGEACFTGLDCASGECAGDALSICASDGRTCASAADCPSEAECVALGVRDGICR